MLVNKIITLYNPAEKNKDSLIEEFVVRLNSFERIFNDIKTSKNEFPEQHYLIVGQRGSGKTTLLYRLKYAIEDDLTLNERMLPINLGEEQYHIGSLADLWEALAEILDDYYSFKGLSSKIHEIRKNDDDCEEDCFKALIKSLDVNEKHIILFIDNFGELLKKLGDQETKRLREVLMTYPHIRLIAGTPVTLESVLDYSQPFFEFFKIIELKGLTNKETRVLLMKLAELNHASTIIEKILNEKPERVEILRRLTGGVIRTMVLLFKVFIENEDGESLRDLQLILDSLTPLYKHRMDDLPAQQQKIVDVVAKNWDAISVKDLTKKTRISSKIISAQLRQLEKNQIIEKVVTDSKNHMYHLKERFFNIWYLMRYGRRYDKKRVIWLVRFFETWCDGEELEERIEQHIKNLGNKKYDMNSAILIGEAYVSCGTVPTEIKEKLIETTHSLYPKEFDKTKIDLDSERIKEAQQLLKNQRISDALHKIGTVKTITINNYRPIVRVALECNDHHQVINILKTAERLKFASHKDLYFIGRILEKEIHDYPEAVKYYEKSSKAGNEEGSLSAAKVLYKKIKDYTKAEKIYLALLKSDPDSSLFHREIAHFYAYGKKDSEKAIEHFNRSIALGRATAYFCLGAFYHFELKDFEMARTYYMKNEKDSYFNLGILYSDLKEDYKTAIDYLEKAAKAYNESDPYLALGRIYSKKLKKKDTARKYYEIAYKDYNEVRAIHPLAHIYAEDKKTHTEAIKFYKLAIEKGDYYAAECLSRFYMENNINKEEAISLINEAKVKLKNETSVYEYSANIMLWADEPQLAIDDLKTVLKDQEYVEREIRDITTLIIKLISKGLYYPVLKLFQNPDYNLIDIMKPVYYSLMTLMKDDFPNEILKMGPEIEETVNEIIQEIKKVQE
jgi:tetratricopeptide (TPR) repeat protein